MVKDYFLLNFNEVDDFFLFYFGSSVGDVMEVKCVIFIVKEMIIELDVIEMKIVVIEVKEDCVVNCFFFFGGSLSGKNVLGMWNFNVEG